MGQQERLRLTTSYGRGYLAQGRRDWVKKKGEDDGSSGIDEQSFFKRDLSRRVGQIGKDLTKIQGLECSFKECFVPPDSSLVRAIAVRISKHPRVPQLSVRFVNFRKILRVFTAAILGFSRGNLQVEEYFYISLQQRVANREQKLNSYRNSRSRQKKDWLKENDPYNNGSPRGGWELWLEEQALEISEALAKRLLLLIQKSKKMKDKRRGGEYRLLRLKGVCGERRLVATVDVASSNRYDFKVLALQTIGRYSRGKRKRFTSAERRRISLRRRFQKKFRYSRAA